MLLHFDRILLRTGPLLHLGGNMNLFRRLSILHCERRLLFFCCLSIGMFSVLIVFIVSFGALFRFRFVTPLYLLPALRCFLAFLLLFLLSIFIF